ncbi:CAMSAP CH domain [Parelaphostrongylus tenuis]|uniref:CAMSAP CH domain n=1 Tax=Parelaphostrongylus tenuis TaxID=148309 RepID=A0AAD5RDH8_PARTN|nr:CAMSAP CH domain [Parelaphostrongylus tenuis]
MAYVMLTSKLRRVLKNLLIRLTLNYRNYMELLTLVTNLPSLSHQLRFPDNDSTEELRQRSAWDLSKLRDLLRNLGDSIGDKIAALAAFNAARQETEDQLLRITSPEATEKTPEELKKDEDTLCRLQQRISELDRSALDDERRNERDQLLDRLDKVIAAVKRFLTGFQWDAGEHINFIIVGRRRDRAASGARHNDNEQRRVGVEDEIARSAADESLRNTLTPISTRLAQLVNNANRLLLDPQANHPSVEALNVALSSAENIIPVLGERAENWDEFVRVRDEVDADLNKLRQPLDEVLTKSRRSISDAINDLERVSAERQKSIILDDKVRKLQELSERLDPLESASAEVRFIDVDVEQTEKQYDDLLNELLTEIEDEKRLCDSVDHFINEINSICNLLTETTHQGLFGEHRTFSVASIASRTFYASRKT